jgi:hypothetical protein
VQGPELLSLPEIELLTAKRVTLHSGTYQAGISGCPSLYRSSRFLRAYNNTGSQHPVAQWQINWDNPWEVYNFTYSEYGLVLLDPDGAIRHTETRDEAEARKNKLTVGDEFKFLLAFALGLRRVRIFEKSTGYDPEATVKINAGLHKLPQEKWTYYGLTTCSNTEAPGGFHRTVKPVDIWIIKFENFKLECQADRSADRAAKLADIEILPFDRKTQAKRTPNKTEVTWKKTAVEVKIPGKSEDKTVNEPYEKTSGYFAAKNRCKNKANRAARSKPKRTRLSRPQTSARASIIRQLTSVNRQTRSQVASRKYQQSVQPAAALAKYPSIQTRIREKSCTGKFSGTSSTKWVNFLSLPKIRRIPPQNSPCQASNPR